MSPRKAAALRNGDGASLREHLIATAERMLSNGGTAALTVRAIAKEAGVADGVLYNHFADKEELIASALRAHVRTVEAGLGALPEPGTGTVERNLRAQLAYGMAMHAAILPAFAGLIDRPSVLSRFAERQDQDGEPPWKERLLGYLRAERDLGRLAAHADLDAAAAMIIGVCHENVLSTVFPSAPETPAPKGKDVVDGVVAVVLDGIRGER
ncbi:TetR family transcriptional regulator [Prauserella marina]|uniref:DNA-binding transcriptional regulator, AcrR family n=1 Tax=Prauserella marina TaxID=530584 RepID=A0A222VR18_9PSEU|nr:TetR/AcrR family transcriptional regulator [Prauserella marina]ASR36349.1 TetR family transcriptional regulator [Prauserella marina]PWV77139.1 TetR family transcriptional regulator [Prauserella marina]SDD05338.1 DNA-binding transcriptional regulator, AcrR family [Prauserella marina]